MRTDPEALVVVALGFEQLAEMRLAVDVSMQRSIVDQTGNGERNPDQSPTASRPRARDEDSPECRVAVKAAETAFVIDVLERYQPLQRIDCFQAGDALLPRRGAELLRAVTFTLTHSEFKNRTSFRVQSPPADSPGVPWRGRPPLLEWAKKKT